MRNLSDLLGVPFIDGGRDPKSGLDCYGLFSVVCSRFGNDIPDVIVSAFDTLRINEMVNMEKGTWGKMDKPAPGCAILFSTDPNYPDLISHLGVYVGGGKFIHTLEKTGVILSSLEDYYWKNKAKGFYGWISPS